MVLYKHHIGKTIPMPYKVCWITIKVNIGSLQEGMLTTFPQCNFSLEFIEILKQRLICYR